MRKSLTEILDSGLIALGLVFLIIRPFVVQAFYIPTGSMEPTLIGAESHPPGDRVLVCKFLYHVNPPRRGDIIVFRAPSNALASGFGQGIRRAPQDFIKRLIGLPGDRIQIQGGVGVYVNGKLLAEPYIRSDRQVRYSFPGTEGEYQDKFPPLGAEFEVGEQEVFVLGDNRNSSNDSHMWGTLPIRNVVGKAMAIFWPPTRVRIVE
ncbi:hypothetical protein AMK68_04190 [candidate division KD3-62 bacterium DG_56]|uniref:Signal peptidase I n=1 Tax=candidate division KD3-62 bacterium DG_56 TaxID=1704032 RepID=A0A0S7XKR2_9BACT|nr:MAG: hypothetical protein AMK68_04190 [candidate division KD3-62 bacterium DG_56]